ncbi:MAG: ferrous iron transport protein A [Robiginitomaculum sp.]|nr:ferrous iron transport protein A [Robiginitomaculum sp.]
MIYAFMAKNPTNLDELPSHKTAQISGFAAGQGSLIEKLREIGFAEGDEVEVLHRGFIGGSPLWVRLNRSIIALRKIEAAQIQVVLHP